MCLGNGNAKISDTHPWELVCLTNTVCCPRCAGLAQGAAHPALHAQLRNLPLSTQKCTQQKGKCLLSSSCGMQLPPHSQAGQRLPVGGKALPLAPRGWRVLAAVGASVWPQSPHAGTAGGPGGMRWGGGTSCLWGPGAEPGERARPVKGVKKGFTPIWSRFKALHVFKAWAYSSGMFNKSVMMF